MKHKNKRDNVGLYTFSRSGIMNFDINLKNIYSLTKWDEIFYLGLQ